MHFVCFYFYNAYRHILLNRFFYKLINLYCITYLNDAVPVPRSNVNSTWPSIMYTLMKSAEPYFWYPS